VPRKLADGHNKARVATSLTLLQRYVEEGEAFLSTVIATDET
jgi:hypothetical protein